MYKSHRKLEKSAKRFSKQKENILVTIAGELGLALNGQKLVEVPNRKGFVYVRLRNNTSEVIQAYNSEVSTIYGLPVLVARSNNIYKVIGRDLDRYRDWGNIPYLPKHGGQHSFNQQAGMGADITWIYSSQFMPLLGYPSGTNGSNVLTVAPYLIRDPDGNWKYVGNTGTPSITPYRPSTGSQAVMVLVYLDTVSGNPYLLVGSGSYFDATLTGTSDIYRYIPPVTNPNHIPITAARLTSGTTQLFWGNLYDARPFFHVLPTGSAGGGGSINTGTLDARYLKLDTSNDPLTGQLDIIPTSNGIRGLNIETMGDVSSFDVTQRATGSISVTSSVFTLNREPSGDSAVSFSVVPMMDLNQSRNASGTISGGLLRYNSDGNNRVEINPSIQGTGTLAYLDSDFVLSPGGMLLLLKNHGSPRFHVNASGTAHSNNVPLIKEAPVNGNQYIRQNAGWEIASGGGGSGTYLVTEDLTPQINGTITTFSLSNAPNPILSARLYYNGVRQRYSFNYTVSGSYVETLYTPTTGSVLTIDYNEGSSTGTLNGLIQVQDEGVIKGNVNSLNFVGDGVDASVNGLVARIFVTGSSGIDTIPYVVASTGSYSKVPNAVYIPGLVASPDRWLLGSTTGTYEGFDTSNSGLTWSANPDTVDSNSTIKSHLYIKATTNTEYIGTKSFTPPSGTFDVRSKILIGNGVTNAASIGLHVGNSGNTSRTLIILYSIPASAIIQIRTYTYAGGAYTQRGSSWSITNNEIYLRTVRESNSSISHYFSNNGILWQLVSNTLVGTFAYFAVNNVGYRVTQDAALTHEGASDWLWTFP